jgi:glycosyltransferase involved in cell wall biosynthesis
MTERSLGLSPIVAPVTAPIHDWQPGGTEDSDDPLRGNAPAIICGTITWYKRPQVGLEWIARNMPEVRDVVCLGRDDGSGCWKDLSRLSNQLDLHLAHRVVPHGDLYGLYAGSSVVVVPSALESLGFGLAEALLHAPNVVSSTIPSHLEIAQRVGRMPLWLDEARADAHRETVISLTEARAEWLSAGRALGLRELS